MDSADSAFVTVPRFGSCGLRAGTVRAAGLPSSANPANELILLRIDN